MARAGYAAKAAVYGVISVLALMVAFGDPAGEVGGGRNALQEIGTQSFGTLLLVLTGVGLVGYAIWRIVQAVLDPEKKGTDAPAVVKRVGYFGSGLIHGALAILAFQIAFGAGSSGSRRTYLAQAMDSSAGRWAIVALGLFVIGAGIYQLYKAYTSKFMRDLKVHQMSRTERRWAKRIGRVGYAARGVVFPIIGFFITKAAIEWDPNEARGVGGALGTIASQTYGTILLAVVAAGLFAYGVYQLVQARYRRIPVR